MEFDEFRERIYEYSKMIDDDKRCPLCNHDHFAGDPNRRYEWLEDCIKDLYQHLFIYD